MFANFSWRNAWQSARAFTHTALRKYAMFVLRLSPSQNILQGMLLSCIGTAAGAALGHGAFAALAYLLREKTAVNLTAGFTLQEGIMIAVVVAAASVFSFIPAAAACRRQAADDL